MKNAFFLGAIAMGTLLSGPSAQAAATVGTFTGGDPGEGLDLQGVFAFAVNVGPNGAAGKVGDADFSGDDVAGVTVIAQNNIGTGGWGAVNYGETEQDKRLAVVMSSIRWSAAPNVVTVRLKVEKGVEYKLQLLFREECCAGRGYNIILAGQTEVVNFMPGAVQTGETGDFQELKGRVGAVVTHTFKAATEEFEFILDGPAADGELINDRNAILNGFTLERLSPTTDVDADGLRDDWEARFFGNLDAKASDDSDSDGLTNADEQTLGLNPKSADTDSDGLSDGHELKISKTDPVKRDSDGDSLDDGLEVNVLQTDPTKTDSDGDGFGDAAELAAGTNPVNKAVKPVVTTVTAVTGADPGEGLDLDGTFLYALALGGPETAAVKVRDAQFTPILEAEVPGANLIAGNTIPNWYGVNFGDGADDAALAAAVSSIRWSAAGNAEVPEVVLTLDNLEDGGAYKVQLMFGEACCNRGFDVLFDGKLVVDNFNPGNVHGGINNRKQVALITRYHFAKGTRLVIRLDGRTAPFPDRNAIFNAITVEKLSGKLDTDNDGLPDEWEKLYFGNLSAAGAADADNDGLTNAQEFEGGTDPTAGDAEPDGLNDAEEKVAGTSPNNADSDGDGLRDGDEVKVYKTNPTAADTDGDSLADGLEINRYKSDPTKPDSDGDGFSDLIESLSGSEPNNSSSKPDRLIVRPVKSAQPADGLDFRGKFVWALNVGGFDGTTIGDAVFSPAALDTVPEGVAIDLNSNIDAWNQPDYGSTADDDGLEFVMTSIRHNGGGNTVNLTGLTKGNLYKLQLLFLEQCCSRGFDVLVNGQMIVDEFAPYVVQGGINNQRSGAAIIYTFVSPADTMSLSLNGDTVTTPAYNDHNEILNGLTLEDLGAAPAEPTKPTSFRLTRIVQDANGFRITCESVADVTYLLEYKERLTDAAWQTVTQVKASGASTTLEDSNPAHRATLGFWRIRVP